ncbi:MAG: hypothetical protein KGJ23_15440 [Euryarchaeota archaeon]|nr:hypothetical protein [Euryarchaeota archaeon]MDE1837993.1 hypothetical protein [Euryarchaeota archaeon]MDE2046448.1 hypothetical protein [Thermoplasmata archaeon]
MYERPRAYTPEDRILRFAFTHSSRFPKGIPTDRFLRHLKGDLTGINFAQLETGLRKLEAEGAVRRDWDTPGDYRVFVTEAGAARAKVLEGRTPRAPPPMDVARAAPAPVTVPPAQAPAQHPWTPPPPASSAPPPSSTAPAPGPSVPAPPPYEAAPTAPPDVPPPAVPTEIPPETTWATLGTEGSTAEPSDLHAQIDELRQALADSREKHALDRETLEEVLHQMEVQAERISMLEEALRKASSSSASSESSAASEAPPENP